MPAVLSVVGKKKSGKTSLIEKILPCLNQRGLMVATVKHDVHRFVIDHEGKDTFRHQQAGAAATVICSPQKMALIKKTTKAMPLDELIETYLSECDLVITEGFASADKPKIEVIRVERGLICEPADLMATVGPQAPGLDIPHFDWNDAESLASFIFEKFFKK